MVNPIIIEFLTPFLFRHKTTTFISVRGYALRNVYASISENIRQYKLQVNHF